MSERESTRIVALKQAVETAIASGMSESEVLAICKVEVFGAAKLRAAIAECLAPDKVMRMSYYEHKVEKKLAPEQILAAVNQAVSNESR